MNSRICSPANECARGLERAVTRVEHRDNRHHTETEERDDREAGLDETIEASFPASDPPSTDPNPDTHDSFDESVSTDRDADFKR